MREKFKAINRKSVVVGKKQNIDTEEKRRCHKGQRYHRFFLNLFRFYIFVYGIFYSIRFYYDFMRLVHKLFAVMKNHKIIACAHSSLFSSTIKLIEIVCVRAERRLSDKQKRTLKIEFHIKIDVINVHGFAASIAAVNLTKKKSQHQEEEESESISAFLPSLLRLNVYFPAFYITKLHLCSHLIYLSPVEHRLQITATRWRRHCLPFGFGQMQYANPISNTLAYSFFHIYIRKFCLTFKRCDNDSRVFVCLCVCAERKMS